MTAEPETDPPEDAVGPWRAEYSDGTSETFDVVLFLPAGERVRAVYAAPPYTGSSAWAAAAERAMGRLRQRRHVGESRLTLRALRPPGEPTPVPAGSERVPTPRLKRMLAAVRAPWFVAGYFPGETLGPHVEDGAEELIAIVALGPRADANAALFGAATDIGEDLVDARAALDGLARAVRVAEAAKKTSWDADGALGAHEHRFPHGTRTLWSEGRRAELSAAAERAMDALAAARKELAARLAACDRAESAPPVE